MPGKNSRADKKRRKGVAAEFETLEIADQGWAHTLERRIRPNTSRSRSPRRHGDVKREQLALGRVARCSHDISAMTGGSASMGDTHRRGTSRPSDDVVAELARLCELVEQRVHGEVQKLGRFKEL